MDDSGGDDSKIIPYAALDVVRAYYPPDREYLLARVVQVHNDDVWQKSYMTIQFEDPDLLVRQRVLKTSREATKTRKGRNDFDPDPEDFPPQIMKQTKVDDGTACHTEE